MKTRMGILCCCVMLVVGVLASCSSSGQTQSSLSAASASSSSVASEKANENSPSGGSSSIASDASQNASVSATANTSPSQNPQSNLKVFKSDNEKDFKVDELMGMDALTFKQAKWLAGLSNLGTYLFIKRGEYYMALNKFKATGTEADGGLNGTTPLIIHYEGKDLGETPVIDVAQGDQLVIMADRRYYFWPVQETGESSYYDGIGAGHGLDHRFVELDGKSLTEDGPEDEEILASKGARYLTDRKGNPDYYHIVGPDGTTFIGTTKKGVDYKDEVIVIDDPYLTFDETDLKPEVIETREGYWILDISAFPSGLYAGSVADFHTLDDSPDFLFRVK